MTGSNDFWTRRRAAVEAEAKSERKAEDLARKAEEQSNLEEKSDEEILSELKLPDPESMQKGDDFSAFMSKAVPARLRHRALRRLWLTNPVLANLDELLEYGEDFTDAATVVENLQTAYQVGKGMLSHVEKMAEAASQLEERAADEEQIGNGEETEDIAEVADDDPDVSSDVAEPAEEPRFAASNEAVKRRMRFKFSEETTKR